MLEIFYWKENHSGSIDWSQANPALAGHLHNWVLNTCGPTSIALSAWGLNTYQKLRGTIVVLYILIKILISLTQYWSVNS